MTQSPKGLPGFGELRSLLQQPQDSRTWRAICRWLEARPSGLEEDTFAYLKEHLRRWPPALRKAPKSWWPKRSAYLPLARVFDLSQAGLGADQVAQLHLLDPREAWSLSLSKNWIDDKCIRHLATLGPWESLEHLDVSFNRLGQQGVSDLWESARRGAFPRLGHLNLDRTEPEEGALLKLGACPLVETLESLSLRMNWLRAKSVADLRMHADFKALRHLHLDHNRFGSLGVLNLMTMPGRRFERLETLTLAQADLDERACSSLAWSKETPSLCTLDLGSNAVGDQGVRYLAESSLHPRLHTLGLSHAGLGDDALWALAETPYFQSVERLDLSQNHFSPHGAGHLTGRRDQLDSLRHVDLSGQEGIGEAVATTFLTWARLPSLHSLHLMACGIGTFGLPALVGGPPWQVRTLNLSFNPLSAAVLDTLFCAVEMPHLETLDLTQCQLGGHIFDVLLKHAPTHAARLHSLHLHQNTLTEQDCALLLEHLDQFPRLRAVSLDPHNHPLAPQITRALRARTPLGAAP